MIEGQAYKRLPLFLFLCFVIIRSAIKQRLRGAGGIFIASAQRMGVYL